MASKESIIPVTVLPSGVSMRVLGSQAYDWDSIRVLAEKGVAYAVIARHFKGLDVTVIRLRASREKWMTVARTNKMRRDMLAKQSEALEATGDVRDPEEVMAEIWRERQRAVDDKAFAIVEHALDGVTAESAMNMIAEAKDLKTMVDIGRKVTGQDKRDAAELDAGPGMAVAVNFLRSTGPEQVEILDV
tara:strand:- start:3239 stop:3805 length:567 start_codon:yes stop_codon:yes gene_type:complete